ncbi:MAG: hypothetical protein K2N04_06710 [Alistipes sp.]|nr:hypothetical protein [Alistipes sp.]
MSTNNKNASGGHFAIWLLLFCMAAVIAVVLLITALVVWLSEVLDSLIWSTLAVGGFFTAAAAGIYLLTLKGTIQQIRDRLDTVYDVARLLKQGYDWVVHKLDFFIRLRNELRRTE